MRYIKFVKENIMFLLLITLLMSLEYLLTIKTINFFVCNEIIFPSLGMLIEDKVNSTFTLMVFVSYYMTYLSWKENTSLTKKYNEMSTFTVFAFFSFETSLYTTYPEVVALVLITVNVFLFANTKIIETNKGDYKNWISKKASLILWSF